MNRLIIVGNGFDLAHGLKTRYEDFIVNYLKSSIVEGINSDTKTYQDKLIKINLSKNQQLPDEWFDSINCLQDFEKCKDILLNYKNNNQGVYFSGQSRTPAKSYPIEITIISILLKEIIQDNNWTDIENTYYRMVISSLDPNPIKKYNIKDLNDQFDSIKYQLGIYLKKIDSEFLLDKKSILTKNYIRIFKTNILSEYQISAIHNSSKEKIEKTVFLNFNYTNVINTYLKILDSNHFSEIQIHGNISNIGSVVFGFGDELDRHYQNIEDLNKNEYFRHIKSFKYLENSNYRDLMKFVYEEENLEVLIMGHSLGLSDRTMLNQIFEEENVKNIRLFFHANQMRNDLVEKSHSISRHFKNKARMRLVIEPHSKSQPMPQFND